MKFWQKLYLSTLSLFLLIIVFSISMLVYSIYRNNLSMEKIKGNREAYWLEKRISGHLESEEQDIASLPSFYSYDYLTQNSLFSIYHNRELIYTNLDFDDSTLIPEETVTAAMAKVYWQQKSSFYCVYLPIMENPDYTLLYLHELTGLSQFMNELTAICLTVSITGSILLAVFLFFLVKRLTKPLNRLDTAAQEIASGKYNTRITLKGRDEFTSVGRSFNNMAAEVQLHISTLERENRKKQIFIDNFAHEMNTPLTSIRGYGEYLQRGAVTEEERYEALDFITKEADRLSALGKQLLLLADIQEGGFAFSPIDISELIDSLQKLFKERLAQKTVTLTFTNNISTVYGERSLLESLAANLIENSIRACEAGGNIQVSFDNIAKGWSLKVKDNGHGIPEEFIAYILEPFYRPDKSRSRANGGTGLGLTLCDQIAQLHHGQISITSKEAAGTQIAVNFTTL